MTAFTYTFSWHMHAHIHGHPCLRHTRTHTRSNATVVTGFCSSFPLAKFPFPLFSVPLVNKGFTIIKKNCIMQGRELHTLQFWPFVRILPDDFFLGRLLTKFSLFWTFGFVFWGQWDKHFQIREGCKKPKGFFFSDKGRSCWIENFSISCRMAYF